MPIASSGVEKPNIEIAKIILKTLNKPENLIQFVEDRKGHDFRYSMDASKVKKLGWKIEYTFEEYIKKTIQWYKENIRWWKSLVK